MAENFLASMNLQHLAYFHFLNFRLEAPKVQNVVLFFLGRSLQGLSEIFIIIVLTFIILSVATLVTWGTFQITLFKMIQMLKLWL